MLRLRERYVTPNGELTDAGWQALTAEFDALEAQITGGGVSDGDKGDITVSGSGAVWTIDNAAVSLAKMADMATDSFIGRDTAGTGVPEVLSAATARTILNVADGATANSADATLLARANHTGTQAAATISDFDTAVAANSAVTANTAKVTNATHTGDVTGATALTIDKTAITGKSAVTADAADYVLISDTSDAGDLKKALVSDFAGGGSDPWTYVSLGSDFVTSLTANTAVTGLNFTPAADTTYVIEGLFLLRTATTTVGARPGISWPTGYTDGANWITAPNSATAAANRFAQAGSTQNAASTGLANTTTSHLGTVWALLVMGGSPSGNFQVTLATETAATDVTMRAGSFIRYRAI